MCSESQIRLRRGHDAGASVQPTLINISCKKLTHRYLARSVCWRLFRIDPVMCLVARYITVTFKKGWKCLIRCSLFGQSWAGATGVMKTLNTDLCDLCPCSEFFLCSLQQFTCQTTGWQKCSHTSSLFLLVSYLDMSSSLSLPHNRLRLGDLAWPSTRWLVGRSPGLASNIAV